MNSSVWHKSSQGIYESDIRNVYIDPMNDACSFRKRIGSHFEQAADRLFTPLKKPLSVDFSNLVINGQQLNSEGEVYLLTQFAVSDQVKIGDVVTVGAEAKWLSCREICVPGKASISIDLAVFESASMVNEEIQAIFDRQRALLPIVNENWQIESFVTDDRYRLRFAPKNGKGNFIKSIAFFPYRNDIMDHAAEQEFTDNGQSVELAIKKSSLTDELIQNVRGLAVIDQITTTGEETLGVKVDIPVFE